MTLLSMAQGLAKNVGLRPPEAVIASANREMVEALQFANETGEELARRVDWGRLHALTTITGDGTNKTFDMPAGFSRLSPGIAVLFGSAIVRPLTRQEWTGLVPVSGTPRYFLLEGNKLTLWPYMANAEVATIKYQSKNWTSAGNATFMADDETSLINEDVFLKGLIARWRRQKGMPYQDEEAEFEAALSDAAGFDDRARF